MYKSWAEPGRDLEYVVKVIFVWGTWLRTFRQSLDEFAELGVGGPAAQAEQSLTRPASDYDHRRESELLDTYIRTTGHIGAKKWVNKMRFQAQGIRCHGAGGD